MVTEITASVSRYVYMYGNLALHTLNVAIMPSALE